MEGSTTWCEEDQQGVEGGLSRSMASYCQGCSLIIVQAGHYQFSRHLPCCLADVHTFFGGGLEWGRLSCIGYLRALVQRIA